MILEGREGTRQTSVIKSQLGDESVTKKEFLNQYRNAEREIAIKLDEIVRLREMATKVTQVLTPDKVKGGMENRREESIAKIVDMEKEIGASIDNLKKIREQVEYAINAISNANQRDVLRLRYLDGMKWEQIAVKLNYDYRWVLRLHGMALHEIAIESHY